MKLLKKEEKNCLVNKFYKNECLVREEQLIDEPYVNTAFESVQKTEQPTNILS